jgi:enamine deaminase RidA (YjgF/YER057c/UK114 family)
MERRHATPQGHWGMPVDIPYPMGLHCGDSLYTCGQCDFDGAGNVLNPGDLEAQSTAVIAHLGRVLAELDAGFEDVARLGVFYVNDGSVDEATYLASLRALLGGAMPAIAAVPLPCFYYPGMMVEIDAVALPGAGARRVAGRGEGVRHGETVYLGNHAGARIEAALDAARATLAALDSDLADTVKLTVCYTDALDAGAWETLTRAFPDPGPVLTALPLPGLDAPVTIELVAMDGARRHHGAGPFPAALASGDKIFIGGLVSPEPAGDLVGQTRRVMAELEACLAAFGAGLADLVKVNTFYVGGVDDGRLHENLNVRSGYFHDPGPASTGIAVPTLAPPDAEICVEAIAMA